MIYKNSTNITTFSDLLSPIGFWDLKNEGRHQSDSFKNEWNLGKLRLDSRPALLLYVRRETDTILPCVTKLRMLNNKMRMNIHFRRVSVGGQDDPC